MKSQHRLGTAAVEGRLKPRRFCRPHGLIASMAWLGCLVALSLGGRSPCPAVEIVDASVQTIGTGGQAASGTREQTIGTGGQAGSDSRQAGNSQQDNNGPIDQHDRQGAAQRSQAARFEAAGIDGALVIVGGGGLPKPVIDRFLQLAGGEQARVVVIPTASRRADRDDADSLLKSWNERNVESVVLLHTRDRKRADDPEFVAPLKTATAVWFGGGIQSRIADAYLGTAVERELHALLKRGGVIGGTSAGAAIMSRLMITGGNPMARVGQGFDLLPGAVIDQHFLARNRKPRLLGVLGEHPGRFGVGIDEATALVVQGRRMECVGDSTVTLGLGASDVRPVREIELKAGDIADLTTLRRAALARSLPHYPPAESEVPSVKNGSLVIVGGGSLPKSVVERFIELAGGPDAPIVVIPTAMPDPIVLLGSETRLFTRHGATNVKVLHGRTQAEVEAPKFLDVLREARGVWFGGGRQWRFVDAYAGTRAEELFHDVLRRGGVIGGSSAGASIQAGYLCRGNPLGNREMMAEGYERGFNFLPGTAIDQHFSQRKRFADMAQLKKAYPQLLGIGIDEGTALIVQGHIGEVVGTNKVYFYGDQSTVQEADSGDGNAPNADDPMPNTGYKAVSPGGRYDLKQRHVLESAVPAGQSK